MANKIIKLTEQDVKNIIIESVNKIIGEWHDYDNYDDSNDIDDLDYADAKFDSITDDYENDNNKEPF